MNPGKLRFPLELQAPDDAAGADSGLAPHWNTLATVRADIEPLSGREYFAAAQVNAEISHRIRLWYRTDVTPKCRGVWGTRTFDFVSVINVGERNIELEIMAVETV